MCHAKFIMQIIELEYTSNIHRINKSFNGGDKRPKYLKKQVNQVEDPYHHINFDQLI